MKELRELKEMFKNYQLALDEANKAEKEWDKNPCNEELEKAFDDAWEKEYRLYVKLIEKIVSLGKGKISRGTAGTMINTKYEQLEELMKKIA